MNSTRTGRYIAPHYYLAQVLNFYVKMLPIQYCVVPKLKTGHEKYKGQHHRGGIVERDS